MVESMKACLRDDRKPIRTFPPATDPCLVASVISRCAAGFFVRCAMARSMKTIRTMISNIMSGRHTKNEYIPEIGCTPEELRFQIERQFIEEMSWKNYGAWNIDHITPCCFFDPDNIKDIFECHHWSNLRPMFAGDHDVRAGREGIATAKGPFPDYQKLRYFSPRETYLDEENMPHPESERIRP